MSKELKKEAGDEFFFTHSILIILLKSPFMWNSWEMKFEFEKYFSFFFNERLERAKKKNIKLKYKIYWNDCLQTKTIQFMNVFNQFYAYRPINGDNWLPIK